MKNPISALVATLLIAGCATSPKPLSITDKIEASAVVTHLDIATRTMSLKTDAGEEHTVVVSTDVRNLPQVKVGDRVTVGYYEAIGAEMRKPGDSTTETVELAADRAQAGQRPGGVIAAVQTIPVTIVAVDSKTSTVRFYGSDKQVRSITVERPEAKAYIKKLKAGDEVVVTYSEAVAVEVTPAQ